MPPISVRTASRRHDLAVLGIATLVLALGSRADAQSPPAPVTRGGAFVNIAIPKPIDLEELDRYANTLKLDDGQFVVLQMLHRTYLDEDKEFRKTEIKKLWDQSSSIAEQGDLGRSLQTGEEFAALMRARSGIVRRLALIDERLFSQMTSYLDEWQDPLLEQVRHQRMRVRCNAARSEYPGGTIDLAVLLHGLRQMGALEVPDGNSFDGILFEYDISVTPLFERRYQAKLKVMAEGPRILAVAFSDGDGEMTDEAVLAKRQQGLRKRQSLRARHVHAARQIRELNERYLDRFSEVLAERSVRMLRGHYRAAVYPTVYPDPDDIGHLFKHVLELETLTETQSDAIKALELTYRQRQTHISEMMARQYLSWHDTAAERGWQHPDARHAFEDEMQRLSARRQENAEATESQVRDILTPAQLSQIGEDRPAPVPVEH